MAAEYAHALVQALNEAPTTAEKSERLSHFLALLKQNGKRKALPAILTELERIGYAQRTRAPRLEVGKEKDAHAAVHELRDMLPDAAEVSPQHNEALIGGWRYRHGDTLIDASHKGALAQLYRRFVAE